MALTLSTENSRDEAAIRDLIESWARAVREHNLPGILANHASEIVMFDVPQPFLSRGIEAYERTWSYFFAEANNLGIFDIDSLEVTAGNNIAFAVAVMHCGTPDKNGPKGQLQFRLTVGLRKIDRQWLVFHEHHSIPAI
jgi:uncharacterized protein (TIGR02246 family)